MAYNRTTLMGRLTEEPSLKETASGHQVLNFTLAVDRGYGENKKTDFFPIIAWNGTAEAIAKYVKKGNQLLVSGQLQNRQWEDNKGSKHTTTELIATEFAFCEAKSTSSTNPSTEGRNASHGSNKPVLQQLNMDDNDIPF